MNFQIAEVATQKAALAKLATQTQRSIEDPIVRRTAIAIVSECASRDDRCELEAIFNAVKHGDPRVKALAKGFKYVADPVLTDYFVSPRRNLENCTRFGSCGGDCDDHAALIAALAGAIGFTVGLRIYGPDPRREVYTHVYAIIKYPKRPPFKGELGMDTTVDRSRVGWQPPRGRVFTTWLNLRG